MADMKLDEVKLLAAVEKSAQHAKEAFEEQVNVSKQEVGEVWRAFRHTPDNVAELFRTAVIAQVKEVLFEQVQQRLSVQLESPSCAYRMLEYSYEPDPVPAGKYRALFFLVKVEE